MSPKKAVYKLYNRLRFHRLSSAVSRVIPLAVVFLVLEFYDELSYTIGNTVLPSIRTELALSYAQVGLLLGLPHLINTFIEPVLMLLGDTHLRKGLVVSGGFFVVISCLLVAGAWSFPVMLVGWVASLAGLPTAMWLLLLAPVSLILFVPKPARREPDLCKT